VDRDSKNNKGIVFTDPKICNFMSEDILKRWIFDRIYDYNEDIKCESIPELVFLLKKNEKLKEFLKNKLMDIKILEPTMGEGAFIKSILLEFVRLNRILSFDLSIENFINNCLYGFDIEPEYVNEVISKLSRLCSDNNWNFNSNNFQVQDFLKYDGNFKSIDIVIGNPPYIRQERIKDFKPFLKEKFQVYNGMADYCIYFIEQGYNFLKEDGILSFIISNKWMKAQYGLELRRFLLKNTCINQIIDFNGVKVFKNATIDTSIITIKKNSDNLFNIIDYCKVEKDYVL
jgi:type I restriction-modification system DNA methylase subunit